MSATVIWRPEAMTARLKAAVRPAAAEYGAMARSACPSRTVAGTIFVRPTGDGAQVGSPLPLASYLENGVGPHEIAPKGRVLRLSDGRFVTGPVRHPGMRAQPFLRPLLPAWPGLYRRYAAGAIRGL